MSARSILHPHPASTAAARPRGILAGAPALACVLFLAGCARAPIPTTAAPYDHETPRWAKVLARCATPDGFDYDLLRSDRTDFDAQLAEFEAVTPEAFERFQREERLAFLINAHNAFAVRRGLAAPPGSSLDATSGLLPATMVRDIRLLGRRRSLRGLRDEILGPGYKESRALFLLNWGMHGCADLPPYPVTPATLERLLEERTATFLRDRSRNVYDRANRVYHASPLLKRHRRILDRDFTTLWNFVERYATEEERAWMLERRPRFRFGEFERRLNDLPGDASEPDPEEF